MSVQVAEDVLERAARARRLEAHAHELMKAHKVVEALEVASEAVREWRILTSNEPRFQADLARSLDHLSIRASRTGQIAEALDAAAESAKLWRALTEQHFERYAYSLCEALTRLAPQAARLHAKEFFTLREEAARVLLRLMSIDEERYLLRAAEACLHLASFGGNYGYPQVALQYAHQAVHLWRRLASQDLVRNGPQLVNALKRLSIEQLDTRGFGKNPLREARRVRLARLALQLKRAVGFVRPTKGASGPDPKKINVGR